MHRLFTPRHPKSLSAWARRRRWDMLLGCFPDLGSLRVLDLGGTVRTWLRASIRPSDVVVVNLQPQQSPVPWMKAVVGDACDLAPEIAGGAFDLAFCNSVIEHVGGHARRQALAETVLAAAPRHWVQTPYRYFPVEPHWMFPGFQFLPVAARAAITRTWRLGPRRAPRRPREAALSRVLEVELLSRSELEFYFPDSEILSERILGLTKSLVAVQTD